MRAVIGALLAACGVLACSGCGSSNTTRYACDHAVDPSDPLSLWTAVATDTEYCNNVSIWGDWASECGPYHVRTVIHTDVASDSYYYDAASGGLVAVLHHTTMSVNPTTTCTVGPATFMPPACPGAGPGQKLQQCDGGAAGG